MEKIKNDEDLAKRFNEAEDNESKLKIAKEVTMSLETARKFLEDVKNDEDLQKQLLAAQDPDSRLELIHKKGYDVSTEDLKAVKDEISDEELTEIAGGKEWNFQGCGVDMPGVGCLIDINMR